MSPDPPSQNTNTAIPPTVGGVASSTQLWSGDQWESARCVAQRHNPSPASEHVSQDDQPHQQASVWRLSTRDTMSLYASPHQLVMARGDGRAGWFRVADLTPGDELAVGVGPIPEDLAGRTGVPLDKTEAAEDIDWLNAYAAGVHVTMPSQAQRDALWIAQSEPDMLKVLHLWAARHELPTGHTIANTTVRFEFLRNHPMWQRIHRQVPDLIQRDARRLGPAFLRGLFDRAAVLDRDGGIRLKVPNKHIRQEVQRLLVMPCGTFASIEFDSRPEKKIPYLKLDPPWSRRFSKLIGFTVTRKQQQAATWIDHKVDPDPRQQGPFIWSRVITVTCRRRANVYPVPVEMDGLTLANGFVTLPGDTPC